MVKQGFGNQKFDPVLVFTVGARFNDLEQSLPDRYKPLIDNFSRLHNLFASFEEVLKSLENAQNFLISELEILNKQYHDEYIGTNFDPPEVQRAFSRTIITRYNLEGLKQLCFEIGVNHEYFTSSQSPDTNALELVNYCLRHKRLKDLLEKCQKYHPQINWYESLPGHPCLSNTT